MKENEEKSIESYVNPVTGDFTHVKLEETLEESVSSLNKMIDDYFVKAEKTHTWTKNEKLQFRLYCANILIKNNGHLPPQILWELMMPSTDKLFSQDVNDPDGDSIKFDVPPRYK